MKKKQRHFLFLEPFFGGSHKVFAEGLVEHSRHHFDLVTLPARFWKWRMRGASLSFLKKISSFSRYDGIFATGLMSLSDFMALAGPECPPAMVYFHETQLTYPLPSGGHMDYQFGFTDITTALAADRVLFNSRTHAHAYFSRLPEFIRMMPEHRPVWVTEAIREKSGVLYPGCSFPSTLAGGSSRSCGPEVPPLIVWNHRWEFDKDPETFFQAVDKLCQMGLDFRLALLGERFQAVPKAFVDARKRYGHLIERYGYVDSRKEYFQWLRRGSIIVSAALQENFGVSVVEAVRSGCIPVLPARLSYPEILPKEFHEMCLYDDQEDFVRKLSGFIRSHSRVQEFRTRLSEAMDQYSWERMIDRYDDELDRLARASKREKDETRRTDHMTADG